MGLLISLLCVITIIIAGFLLGKLVKLQRKNCFIFSRKSGFSCFYDLSSFHPFVGERDRETERGEKGEREREREQKDVYVGDRMR